MKTPLPEVRGGRILTDWVTDTLRKAIIEGHFRPGEKVNQDLIAQELDVSRTPVREALKVLESEDFVEIRPHRGAFIALVTQDDIFKTYQVRTLIEAEIVRLVTPVIPDSVLDELEEYFNQLHGHRTPEERAQHIDADIHFHDTVAKYATNELLREILESLNNRVMRVRRFGQLQSEYHLVKSHQEHCAILKAIQQRNSERAAELMKIHLQRSAERIHRAVNNQ